MVTSTEMWAQQDRAAAVAHREAYNALRASARRKERGALGERMTLAALAPLVAEGWRLLPDRVWPGTRGKHNIDCIAVGPGGLAIIDSKHVRGSLSIAHDTLWQGRTTASTMRASRSS